MGNINHTIFSKERFKYITILSHIWLMITIPYFALDVTILGKEGVASFQNPALIPNVIAPIGINQGKTFQKDLF